MENLSVGWSLVVSGLVLILLVGWCVSSNMVDGSVGWCLVGWLKTCQWVSWSVVNLLVGQWLEGR